MDLTAHENRKVGPALIGFYNACHRVWERGVDYGRPAAFSRMWLEIGTHAASGHWAVEP